MDLTDGSLDKSALHKAGKSNVDYRIMSMAYIPLTNVLMRAYTVV